MRSGFRVLLILVALLALAAPVSAPASTTTLQRTIQDRDNDNLLEEAPGEDYTVLPGGGAAGNVRRPNKDSILNFLQLTDFQAVDEESPGRVEFFDTTQRGPFNPFSAAYRPQEALSTQVVDAMVRQARNTTSQVTGERLKLTMVTGDNADSQQYNETRWFIDLLDGNKEVDPNSGIPTPACPGTPGSPYDGPKGGGPPGYYNPDGDDDGDGYSPDRAQNIARTPGRDVTVRDFAGMLDVAQDRFRATGLGMPWYSAFGNHDALVQGNDPDAYAGPFGAAGESSNPALQGLATGCVKPTAGAPDTVPPDARRCYLAKDEETGGGAPAPCSSGGWIQQHFKTTGTPVGHGFANRPPQAMANHDGYYSFSPRPGLRFVVLDTITDECGTPFCAEGTIDDDQYQWLDAELGAAAAAGEYVVGFSHHTLRTIRFVSVDAAEEPVHYGERIDPRTGQPVQAGVNTLEDLYCRHPNVLAHVDGHEHSNTVIHHDCSEPTQGPGDFWEIGTAAHIDWPQQSRMLELFLDGDKKLSLAATILDHAGAANPGGGRATPSVLRLASIARELSYNDYQTGPKSGTDARGGREDRNVIIRLGRPFPCGKPCS